MLQSRFKLYDSDVTTEQLGNLSRLCGLLAEKGCKIFEVTPDWRRHKNDRLILPMKLPLSPVHAYPGSEETIILRPWGRRNHLKYILSLLTSGQKRKLKLRQGKGYIARANKEEGWTQYLSPASLVEARLLGLIE